MTLPSVGSQEPHFLFVNQSSEFCSKRTGMLITKCISTLVCFEGLGRQHSCLSPKPVPTHQACDRKSAGEGCDIEYSYCWS